MTRYNHKKIEKKWQKIWEKNKVFQAFDKSKKPKKFVLCEFPYPSGAGLHMGHLRPYVAGDVYSRYHRLKGFETLFPMGWDAFGLPAENYAIKMGVHPSITTAANIKNAKRQLQSWGMSFDWSREINTTDPNYYKWTQWLFLQFYKKGLAYEATGLINWCPKDKTGLANEEVIDGKCERCGTIVEKKELRQWYLKITKYAEKLLDGLKNLPDWPEMVKLQQENWIGKKTGINITYHLDNHPQTVTCFTTRPDTNYGATFVVIGPEHPLLQDQNILNIQNNIWQEIESYKLKTATEAETERTAENRKKTGVFTGLHCLNQLTNYKMPLYVADYVLGNVGTGAVVGVPGHDKRDFEFAQVFNIPVLRVVQKDSNDTAPITTIDQVQEEAGTMVNSEFLNGMNIHNATEKIMDYMESKGYGKRVINYKLRDWVFSRQRYWGEPIPIIHCENCGKKPKVLIIHGLSGHPNENWFPWLKNELEQRNYEVLVPALSNQNPPKLNEWLKELKKLDIKKNEKLIVVGHSLGARTACHYVNKLGIKIEKLILVAPTGNAQNKDNWDNLRKNGVAEDFISSIVNFNKVKINFKKLKKLIVKSIILFSDNDPYIPREVAQDYKILKPKINFLHNKGHFNKKSGITELPEILEYFPVQKVNSGIVPVPEKDLPVKLPNVKKYEPTGTGESPLSNINKWVNVKCPQCGLNAKRETNTMPQWAGSSWYWLRYTDSKNKKSFASIESQKYWTPVDIYFGGMEHTTLHLLYSRFWNLFLYDQKLVTAKEPYKKRVPHGIILGPDGEKMSKSRGNVVNPDLIVKNFGADTLRMYELFLGPHNATVSWNEQGHIGVKRFLDRVWAWVVQISNSKFQISNSEQVDRALHKLIKKVTEDIESFSFNTAISAFMEFHNEIKQEPVSAATVKTFLILLYPFAPHIAEELNELLQKTSGHATDGRPLRDQSLQTETWPKYDPAKIIEQTLEIVVQINGKFKGKIMVERGAAEEIVKSQALQIEAIKQLTSAGIKRVIFVKDRLINLVV